MLGLAVGLAVKVVCAKICALGRILLSFFLVGRKFNYEGDKWQEFFARTAPEKMRLALRIECIAAQILSAMAAYAVMKAMKTSYASVIAAAMALAGTAYFIYKWRREGREYFMGKYARILSDINKNR